MKIDVYVDNMYVDTIEVETQEEADEAADELCTEWVTEHMYWTLAEED